MTAYGSSYVGLLNTGAVVWRESIANSVDEISTHLRWAAVLALNATLNIVALKGASGLALCSMDQRKGYHSSS